MEFFIKSAPILETLVQTTALMVRGNLSSTEALQTRRQLLDGLGETLPIFLAWQRDTKTAVALLIKAIEDGNEGPEARIFNITLLPGVYKAVEIIHNRLQVALGGADVYLMEMSSRDASLLFLQNLKERGPASAGLLEVNMVKSIPGTSSDWMAHAASRHGMEAKPPIPLLEKTFIYAGFRPWVLPILQHSITSFSDSKISHVKHREINTDLRGQASCITGKGEKSRSVAACISKTALIHPFIVLF
ncbi:hypothetical protein VHEMI06865 [[Torrubiella] hemipterigena]|uniref:Uncharacterized protein n=1 Tax=[Torrubiella] hemipterigena TaxID=1531966 RepID=A0A0A1TLW6_9HYPO|nr:hypothetical protein VHEMI06865 [[Torrubiella] hemipterigena]